MYMSGSNNQPDDNNLKTDITVLTDIAVLKSEVENIKQRDRWVQGILGALIVAVLIWVGQNAVGSSQKTNPVVPTIIQK
jgi:hypothetical protein